MDVFSLKQHIIRNPSYIEKLLECCKFHNIRDFGNEYRCGNKLDSNPTSIRISKNSLGTINFSSGLKGDIITLIQEKRALSFKQTIEFISNKVNYKFDGVIDKYVPPFGGFYKHIEKLKKEELVVMETYPLTLLEEYHKMPNLLFYKDGILPKVQVDYKVGFDSVSNRITCPWFTFDGELCGVMGRLNKEELENHEVKWFPVIPFQKSKTLYGFSQNYKLIQNSDICMIGESEKHTMSLASKGLGVGLSLGGSYLSDIQANHIKSLYTNRTLVMLDEGLEEDKSVEIAKKLKFNHFFSNQVGYVFDAKNFYLPKGSKLAPSDLDKSTLKKLLENCTKWI
ncbi:hypothetical protein V1503_19405 [Bacillus sp. SCS-151]|uniref:hypothetical protein n=1 Tax=Nanhaiella sioensis TaxID=3115293 RepID=UPI00397B4E84